MKKFTQEEFRKNSKEIMANNEEFAITNAEGQITMTVGPAGGVKTIIGARSPEHEEGLKTLARFFMISKIVCDETAGTYTFVDHMGHALKVQVSCNGSNAHLIPIGDIDYFTYTRKPEDDA